MIYEKALLLRLDTERMQWLKSHAEPYRGAGTGVSRVIREAIDLYRKEQEQKSGKKNARQV